PSSRSSDSNTAMQKRTPGFIRRTTESCCRRATPLDTTPPMRTDRDQTLGAAVDAQIDRRTSMFRIRFLAMLLAGLLAAPPAFADLKVAPALTDLASVAQFVGGKHVTAQSLCRGFEDPHFVPAKPSLMKAIQHADVYISTGLELDNGWLPLVLPGSRNPKIQHGTKGFVDASQGVQVLEKPTGTVSRAEGDIHPLGNPHYYLDPKALEVVADHLADVFSGLDPASAGDYRANAKAFDGRIEASLKKWQAQLEPYQGAAIVPYHKNFIYFADRFGLKLFATVEPKPGIPPSPHYIA